MATFNVNPRRRAPYKGYKFRVKWDGRYVPGIDRVNGLRRTTEPVTHRGGGDSGAADTSPGQTTYDPIVLERGRTHDQTFERWANKVHNVGGGMGTEVSLGDYRKDVVIDLYNEAGQQAISYRVYGCWPSEYVPLSGLDAAASETATESMTLVHRGWERDTDVTEPTEPTFTVPSE